MLPKIISIEGKNIQCPIVKGKQYVAIRAICNILGIDAKSQRDVIKDNPLFQHTNIVLTAEDGKKRAMLCLEIDSFFGWLMGIHHSKVSPEVSADLIKFQKKCSIMLKEEFIYRPQYNEQKLTRILELQGLERNHRNEANRIKAEKKKLEAETYEDYIASISVPELPFAGDETIDCDYEEV